MGSLIVNRVFASMIAAMLLAAAAEKITKAQLVGSWSLVSTENNAAQWHAVQPVRERERHAGL